MKSALLVLSVVAAALAGCGGLFDADDLFPLPDINLDAFGDVSLSPGDGPGVGEACAEPSAGAECRFGLRCVDGLCAATGETAANRPCILTAECADGLYCSVLGVCEEGGEGGAGAGCSTAADCTPGLVCASTGFSGACTEAGAGDLGAPCAETVSCLAGLACTAEGECGPGGLAFGFRPWPGVTCETTADEGPPRPYFEVPGADGAPLVDFFRLPFPNDVRRANGRIVLDGFPTPGPGLVGFDPVKRIVEAAEAVQSGFSTAPVVIFRFSAPFDLGSVWAGGVADPPPGEPTLYFVDITPSSPTYNGRPAYGYSLTDGGSRYLCPRSLSVRPSWDTPLRPETTYAVILARGVKTSEGVELVADDHLVTLLAADRPTGAALGAAWDAYAPLRAYLADPDAELGAERVIGAAVFTTQPVDDVLPALRDAVHAAPVAAPADVTLCDAGVTSPCDDGLSGDDRVRGCFAAAAEVHELHLRLPLPRVQAGQRPYLRPEDGGDLVFGPAGAVVLQGTEDVCVSLTIPKGRAMPEAGWPVVIYGHGTGGSFRSAVRDAGIPLSSIDVAATEASPEAGPTVGAAVLGWDGPMHGERRGSDIDPEGLFYNFGNPRAARGNLYQGAADLFALVRAVGAFELDAASSPTGEAIRLDAARVAHVGHSQGATTGPLASAYEPDIHVDVWSGAGAGLVQSLLAKKAPVDVPAAVAVALQELTQTGIGQVNDLHPVMGLVQGLFDPVDPLNHAKLLVDRPREGQAPHHTLFVIGVDDTFTPNSTSLTFARLMRTEPATPVLLPVFGGLPERTPPVSGNLTRAGEPVTAVVVQAQPQGYDGHFVMFRDAGANLQFRQFIGTWIRDGVPTVVAR